MDTNTNVQEIDVTKLIYNFFTFVKSKKLIIGLLTLFGIVYGIFNYYSSPKHYKRVYQKTIMISSPIVKSEVIEDIANSIQLIVKSKQVDELENLSKKMNLSKEILTDLVGLNSKKQVSDGTSYWVTIETYNKLTIEEIIKGIITYINANEFVKQNQDVVRKQRKELILEMDKQISSLKETTSSVSAKNIESQYLSSTSRYFTYMDIFEGKQKVEKDLLLSNEVKLVDFGTPLQAKGKLTSYLMVLGYGFFGFFVGLIAAFCFKLVKK